MTDSRNIRQKLDHKPITSQTQWNDLSVNILFCIGTCLGVIDVTTLMKVCRTSSQAMKRPRLWQGLLTRYYRGEAKNDQYHQAFKNCHAEESLHFARRGQRADFKLLRLFKEGDLAEIKKQPRIPREKLLTVEDRRLNNLCQWTTNNGHQNVLNFFFAEAQKELSGQNNALIFWAACFNQGAKLDTLLRSPNADVNPVHQGQTALLAATRMGHDAVVAKLMDSKAEATDMRTEQTPIYVALYFQHRTTLQLLLKKGGEKAANFTGFEFDRTFATPLMTASAQGNFDAITILLEAKAEINDPSAGETALHIATQANKLDVMALLLEKKADVNVRGFWDRTPLHEAAGHDHREAVQLLMHHRADATLRDMFNQAPLISKNGRP